MPAPILLLRRPLRVLGTLLACSLLAASSSVRAQEDPFLSGVRPTPKLSPAEQQKTFQVPPGFVVELVAAEPDILKPLNMAFDSRGRLWVTVTQEYPYAAPLDRPGRDAVKVLEDRDRDGSFETVQTFAEGLNIPIGIYPYRQGAIVFSIPHIWNLQDTDGDGVADERTRLYGPMGYERDTHGMNNAFRRGFDGWLYACHGFNNETRVAGRDGHEIHMQSGNTYRMRLDGQRVEHYTWGQVNPFGMAIDPWFNLYTADCHSKPIYQLLRGGYYPSFGKPHDGLGFVPPMMEHLHGSTAIAGVVHYEAAHFPAEYHGNLFSGNVMTSRVNRNSLVAHGSTYTCREEADFVSTSDPWFRPVDIQLGPDGALYIADFYNRIIGHYEVPLEHPGRDRTSGRIWRVRYVGTNNDASPAAMPNIAEASLEELVDMLGHPNQTCRTLALDELADERGAAALPALERAANSGGSEHRRALTLWAWERISGAPSAAVERALTDTHPLVRVHAFKLLSERAELTPSEGKAARAALEDSNPFVRRAAADVLAQHPGVEATSHLLTALQAATAERDQDALLVHGLRLALRNQLNVPGRYAMAQAFAAQHGLSEHIASVSLAVTTPEAASYLLTYLKTHDVTAERSAEMLQHAARHAAPTDVETLITFARERYAQDVDRQTALLVSVMEALRQRGDEPSEALRSWATEVAGGLLTTLSKPEQRWVYHPLADKPSRENPWVVQTRDSADGAAGAFLCSLPGGEQLTGSVRSPIFEVPGKLTFFIAGHSGFPDKPLTSDNFVQLVDAENGAVLARTAAPRNDLAQNVTWELAEHVGRRAYVEIVDGDNGPAYAWLAAGRFEPAVIGIPDVSPQKLAQRQQAAAAIIGELRLKPLADALVQVLRAPDTEPASLAAAARALLMLEPAPGFDGLAAALGVPLPEVTRGQAVEALLMRDVEGRSEALAHIMQSVPARTQSSIATVLASDQQGAALLLELVRRGRASPRLLLEKAVAERLMRLDDAEFASAVEALTRGLPSPGEATQQLITERREAFRAASHSLENGKAVFTKNCAICHQLDGQGPLVGPQLDGIGNRGLERLLEDVLDPNRNVDVAFRSTTLALASGKVVTGLLRREEGETLVLVDEKGQEFRVSIDEIEEQNLSALSLMPENVATTMEERDFLDLIAFLLSKQAARE